MKLKAGKQQRKSKEQKDVFFEVNKIDKPVAKLKRKQYSVSKIKQRYHYKPCNLKQIIR